MAGRFDSKKRPGGPESKGTDAGQQEEGEKQVEAPESEQARLQSQIGNQGVAAMLAGHGAAAGAGAGLEVEGALRRKEDTEKEVEHGGEDDPVDDGPLTEIDLLRSWNPGTRRSEDRPAFVEVMPADALPPEDEVWLASIKRWPDPLRLPPTTEHDPLLQPSAEAVAYAMALWARGAAALAGDDLVQRSLARLLHPPAPALQDPLGRVLLARARLGAIGTWMLLDAPGLRDGGIGDCALAGFCLEIRARHSWMDGWRFDQGEDRPKIPQAAALLAERIERPGRSVRLRPLEEDAATVLRAAVDAVLDFEDLEGLVPDLAAGDPVDREEDPLGLEEVLLSFTGGAPDPEAGIWKAALGAAEKLAAAAAATRFQLAGAATLIADVAESYSSGIPDASLHEALSQTDRETQSCLELLVEIARAVQRRGVPPRGVRNGLRRCARALMSARADGRERLLAIVGGVLPGAPRRLRAPAAPPDDPLTEAWRDGEPASALPWLASLGDSLDVLAAHTFTRAASGERPDRLLPALREVHARSTATGRLPLAGATASVLGSVLVQLGDAEGCLALADPGLAIGRRRRNAMVVADAALLAMEAHRLRGDQDALQQVRGAAGNLVWQMGATGALTLLARWTPPEEDG